jgi:hypothetical protein
MYQDRLGRLAWQAALTRGPPSLESEGDIYVRSSVTGAPGWLALADRYVAEVEAERRARFWFANARRYPI